MVFDLAGHRPPDISLLKDNAALVIYLSGSAQFWYLI